MSKRSIYISCMLKDNMIVAYKISGNLKEYPHDYYKDFYYAGASMENCDEIYEVKYMEVIVDDDIKTELNNYIFEELARKFYKQWKIHPEHFGSPAY